MVTRGNSPDYAFARFHGHRDRLHGLLDGLDADTTDESALLAATDLAPVPPDVSAFRA
jgi:predicted glycosyl hydrolase (DUF1957 family)